MHASAIDADAIERVKQSFISFICRLRKFIATDGKQFLTSF